MKHGIAFRKFSRTTSHRMLMLRNLVTSLFKHEQIKTTLPKARDTARLAEKIITLGKKGDMPAYQRANAFLLEPRLTPKVFQEFAKRYEHRSGGYTRIHKFGNRPGDNAPHAILELVDNPRDIKFEMTAKAIGWELLSKKLHNSSPRALMESEAADVKQVIETERLRGPKERGDLREKTRWSVQKVLKYRGNEAVEDLKKKAQDHMDTLLARPLALKELMNPDEGKHTESPSANKKIPKVIAGQGLPGGTHGALRLAQGALGKSFTGPSWLARRKLGIDRSDVWHSV